MKCRNVLKLPYLESANCASMDASFDIEELKYNVVFSIRQMQDRSNPICNRLHRLHSRLLQLWLQSARTHRETMKRDNSFPMAINYRINSAARARVFAKLPFLRNQLFCFVAKPIAFRSNRIFFRDWGKRDARVLLLMINFFGTRVRLSFVSNVINPDESFDWSDYWRDISSETVIQDTICENRARISRCPYYSGVLFREHFG